MANLDSVDLNATITSIADTIIADALNSVTTKELQVYSDMVVDIPEMEGVYLGGADSAAILDILTDVFEQRVNEITER